MSASPTEQQARNRAEQARLYGAPLGDLVAEVSRTFSLSQGRLAQMLGISAPMLSQLASGHRVKIGNPSAMVRLQQLLAHVDDVRSGRADPTALLEQVSRSTTDRLLTRATDISDRSGAAEVQLLLRSVAAPADLLAAANALQDAYPALAEVIRVYGAGTNEAALEHYERTVRRD